ncbi:MAG: protein-L-isoaspartate(D-aspartate) O-methyltransferase [Methanobacteriota archaeon]|nr:MAG: protein-L-isoaspartate(D-aspartate) O-methyltransferase [Euryarchaeota archaeon]
MGRGIDFVSERARMVDRLVRSGYLKDPTVRAVFLAVPREAFVRPEDRAAAYQDVPLPIGSGQTISAPSMIAIMLEEAQLRPGERVLEIGTGSGYHAALLASLAGPKNVVSIERKSSLAEWGRSNLASVGFADVTVVVGDGSLGLPDRGPYDCILATAGAPRIPDAWPRQLNPQGRIVAPIGSSPRAQVLVVASRRSDGRLDVREGTPCAFVPLVGAQAWPK